MPSRLFGVLTLLGAMPLAAQQGLDTVRVRVEAVAPGVNMLQARGGNIGVSSGPDGVFVIDDQYAPLTEKIVAAIRTFSSGPIRFVLNTHWHGDHTGGNENMGRTGALLVAHENVRRRMSTEQFLAAFNNRVPPSPNGAWPVVTFTEQVTFYLNGDSIEAIHVRNAHTDGDAIIRFRHADVLHAGDTFFNGNYPFIDLSSGGSLAGIIAATDTMLKLAGPATKIIPGHGALATRIDLERFRGMLVGSRDAMRAAMAGGKTIEQVLAAKPTARWDGDWGKGFINPETWVRILFEDMSK